MANDSRPAARSTYVLAPPVGTFLTRSALLSHAGLYGSLGGLQFLWYAGMKNITVTDAGERWADCVPTGPLSTLTTVSPCDGTIRAAANANTVYGDLAVHPVQLSTLYWQGAWIALVCGNFNGVSVPPPVPSISGIKFNDVNRDGVQDNGETGVAGVTFQLTRQSSSVGQPTDPSQVLATGTSDASGHFSFPLQGDGPGTYVVTEVEKPGWVPTTPTAQTVVVDPGIGNASLPVSFGDRQEIPPVAHAVSLAVDQSEPAGAPVTLDSSGSYSPTGDPLSFTWTWSPSGSASGASPTVTFPPGTTTVDLTVSDGIAATSTSATVTVYPPITAQPVAVSSVEGESFTGPVATFTDPDPAGSAAEYQASIDWGDGTPTSSGSITQAADGTFTVSGSHTYAEEGAPSPTVVISDRTVPYNTATVSPSATVADAALQASGENLISVNPVSGVVATFSDRNNSPGEPASDYTAWIDWGDGSAPTQGVITGPTGGPFAVSGSHAYSSLGDKEIHVRIVDDGGSSADATTPVLVYAPSGFVIGNLDSAIGTHVTYWGARWWQENNLSGGPAPAAFKGYEDTPGPTTSLTGWSTDPGNSPPPPASVPSYMSVIVCSTITQSGSTIYGDAPHIVIVRTDPGYAGDPGHPGTGTVVATLR